MSASSVAQVRTASARRYLVQMVRHFAHKRPTLLGELSGHIAFGAGICDLEAGPDALVLTASASDAEALARLEDVVARHLARFAFREPLRIGWVRSSASAA